MFKQWTKLKEAKVYNPHSY